LTNRVSNKQRGSVKKARDTESNGERDRERQRERQRESKKERT